MSAGEVDLDPASFDLEAHEEWGGEVLSVQMVCRRCRDTVYDSVEDRGDGTLGRLIQVAGMHNTKRHPELTR